MFQLVGIGIKLTVSIQSTLTAANRTIAVISGKTFHLGIVERVSSARDDGYTVRSSALDVRVESLLTD